ncbi:MAG: tetratricopeptide repeat protein [Planctomycetes bacterium]|nr:tetratricopeptide repeat protein [Planctomycetota bacterium]
MDDAQASVDKLSADYSNQPETPRALCEIAGCYLLCKQDLEAKQLYNQLLSIDLPEDIELTCHTCFAISCIRLNDFQSAQTSANKLLTDYTDQLILAYFAMSIANEYRDFGKYPEAKTFYERALSINSPDNIALMINSSYARFCIERGDFESAQLSANKLLTDYSDQPGTSQEASLVARYYFTAGRYSEARQLHARALATNPRDGIAAISRVGLINSIIKLSDFESAQELTNTLLADHSDPQIRVNAIKQIADHYQRANRDGEAKQLYQAVLASNPGGAVELTCLAELAKANIRLDDLNSAQTSINKILTDLCENEKAADMLFGIGRAYYLAEKYTQARELYEAIVARWPGSEASVISRGELMRIKVKSGDISDAESEAGRLASDYPSYPSTPGAVICIAEELYYKSWDFKQAGDLEAHNETCRKAVRIANSVIDNFPDTQAAKDAYIVTGTCRMKLGEYENSRDIFLTFVDKYPDNDKAGHSLFMAARSVKDMLNAGQISRAQANEQLASAYQRIVNDYPQSKPAIAAEKWLNQNN